MINGKNMLTFRNLGSLGRLGNQMFQYASLRGIAHNNNEKWKIPGKNIKGKTDYCLFDCFEMFSVKDNNIITAKDQNLPNKKAKSFEFDIDLYSNAKNVNLNSYLQTEKYFLNIKNEILLDFTFKKDIQNKVKFIKDIIDNNTAFLHIRRGDNTGHPDLVLDPSENLKYYKNAIKLFDKSTKFIVISDEIDWCKNQTFFKNNKFYFTENWGKLSNKCLINNGGNPVYINSTIPYYDLYIMSLCNGGIIPTSTFGWWGAYLQKNRTNPVITQYPWFGPKLSHHNTKDLIPNTWIKLNWEGEII
jgi:hypothetical protein